MKSTPIISISQVHARLLIGLLMLLAISKLVAFYHLPLLAIDHPIQVSYVDVDRLSVLFLFIVTVLFVRQPSDQQRTDFWLITLNILLLTSIAYGLETIQLGLGLSVFLLMMSTAVVEEILLRFALFELFWQRAKPITIVVGSSLFFTLIHSKVYDNFQYGLLVLLTGLLLGGVYAYFRGKMQTVLGVIVVSWLHLGLIVLGFMLDWIPK